MPSKRQPAKAVHQTEKEKQAAKLDTQIDETLKRFGEHVKAIRKTRRITQLDIAGSTGLTSGAQSRIENGDRSLTMRSFMKVAVGLGMRPSELAVMLDWSPGSNTTDRTLIGVPVVVAPGVGPDSVKKVTDELASRGAKTSQLVSKKRKP